MAAQKKTAGKPRGGAKQTRGKANQKQAASGISATELIGLGLVGLAAVSLAVLITGDPATNAIKALLLGLAGVFSWLIPMLLLWIGILVGFAGKKKYDTGRILLMFVAVLLAFAMVHVFYAKEILLGMQIDSYLNFIQESFFTRKGTGALGALLAYPAYSLLGNQWTGLIALFFLFAGCVVWIKQISLRRLGEQARERFENGRTEYRQKREERVQLHEQARAQRLAEQQAQGGDWGDWDQPLSPKKSEPAPARDPGELIIRKGAKPLEVPEYMKNKNKRERKIMGGQAITPETAFSAAPEEPAAPDMPDPFEEADEAQDEFYDEPKQGFMSRLFHKKDEPQDEAEDISAPIEDIPPVDVPPVSDGTLRPLPVNTPDEEDEEEEEAPEDIPEAIAQPEPEEAPEEEEAEDVCEPENGPETVPEAHEAAAPQPSLFSFDDEDDDEPSPLFGSRRGDDEPEEDEETPQADETDEMDEKPVVFPSAAALEKPAEHERHRRVLGQPVKDILPPDSYASDTQALKIEPERRLDGTPILNDPHEEFAQKVELIEYNYPPVDLLSAPKPAKVNNNEQADQKKAQKLIETFKSFGISVELTGIAHGPAVTRFEVYPAPGIKVSRITALADDIALNLAAPSIRIEAPIPGKAAVGIEIPNDTVETVPLREVLESQEARKNPSRLAFGVGKDNGGRCIVGDIAKMPHVLIAGATGSGKSVCINCIICSILYRATPDEVRLIMVDPKVVELSTYNGIPHLLTPVVTDPKKAAGALNWAVAEMTLRYRKFAERSVRNIKGYNASLAPDEKPMPQIVIIIDELADLMMVAPGEVEDAICRLAQLARAAGIHLVIATQRPSVNVITGTIKANIPARIAFTTSSYVDSRTILDVGGAEKLLGRGDMLFAPNGNNKMQRVQGAWVSDEEVASIVEYIKARHDADYDEDVIDHMNRPDDGEAPDPGAEDDKDSGADELLPQAIEMAVEAGQMSISMLQRRLRIGYARAGRLIDDMADRGVVSQSEGAKPRQVLMTREQYNALYGDNKQ